MAFLVEAQRRTGGGSVDRGGFGGASTTVRLFSKGIAVNFIFASRSLGVELGRILFVENER